MANQRWWSRVLVHGRVSALCCVLLSLSGIGGCAPSYMRDGTLQATPAPGKALIHFVRPSFYGAGQSMLLWHEQRFIGNLEAGELVQYEIEPGEHVFMVSGVGWGFVRAEVLANRSYFLKGNIDFVGKNTLGVADAPNDERVARWLTLRAMTIDPQKVTLLEPSVQAEASAMLAEYQHGLHPYAILRPAHGISGEH